MEFLPVDHTDASVAEELLRVQRRAYAVEAELIEVAAIPNLDEAVDDIRQLRLSITAARDADGIVGFIGHTRTGGLVEIDRLAVDPASFRRGIGRALLQHLHDAEPDAAFVVSTPARNTPAVELHISAGYHVEYQTVVAGTLPVLGLRRRRRDHS